jgi:thiol-disulfide isomerase/thioredoxin
MTSYLRLLPVILLGVVLVGCLEAPTSIPPAHARTEAPEIKGVDSAGNELKLSDYRGKVVLVDFWFGSCPPCRENHIHEKVLVQKYKNRPFIILGVNTDRDAATMQQSEKEQMLTWPSVWDGKHLNSFGYGVESFPTMFLIDHKGRFATKPIAGIPLDKHQREKQEKQLESAIERLLQEAEEDTTKNPAE